MKRLRDLGVFVLCLLVFQLVKAEAVVAGSDSLCPDAFNHSMRQLHSSKDLSLCELTKDKPLLIVNTASHCGFTPQFKQLEAIHQQYKDSGLVVLGFASNDFNQAAKTEEEAADICYKNYGVNFTMFAPTSVKGENANSVFRWLAEKTRAPRWNFNKYVVSADRSDVKHFGSMTKPDSKKMHKALEAVLGDNG